MKYFGQKILITGGSSGIGLELARKFQELGNDIIIVGLNRQKLEDVAEYNGFDYIHADLANLSDVAKLIKRINDHHPDLSMLINNAGVQFEYNLGKGRECDIEEEVTVNLTAPIILINGLLPLLIKNSGAIVNVTSESAISPKRSAPVYCATKAGLSSFTKSLRYQLEGTKVNVFEIIPPMVDTPMTDNKTSKKLSPVKLATRFIKDYANDKLESYFGKTKLLKMIHRISPFFVDRMMKNY